MFEQINKHAARYVTFTTEELQIFNSVMTPKSVKKKTFLLREGEICNFGAYINKGCIRNYFIDKNGFEVIIQFAVEDWWVSDVASFYDRTPGNMFIETIEDCELLTFTPQLMEELFMKAPRFERMFRLLVQKNLSVLQRRLFKTIAQTGEEKYLDFIARYPSIPQRVPQHYIASYLGISPEFLSKIRARLVKK